MDSNVAVVASNQGLPMTRGHLLDPGRYRPPTMPLEVLQVAHMVNLHAVVGAAQLTRVREQSFEHLRSGVPGMRRSVIKDGIYPPPKRDATPFGYQRLPHFPLDPNLEPFARAIGGMQHRAEASIDLGIAQAEFLAQRSDQGSLHGVPQPIEAVEVVSHPVVVRYTPKRLLELHEDTEGIIVQVFGPGAGFAMANIGAAFRSDYLCGDSKSDLSIEAASIMLVARCIFGQDRDLVAEESRRFGTCVREQCLGLGKLQVQLLA